MRNAISYCFVVCMLLTSCVHQGYFLSPFQANNQPYRAAPMVSDSTSKATYGSAVASIGGANQSLRDVVFNFQGSLHRAHTFRRVQFHYGAMASAGNYRVTEHYYSGRLEPPPGGNLLAGGDYFFASAGAFGGINLVIPLKTGSEWRVIGLETNYQKEFGDYGRFRKGLGDSVVNAVTRNSHFNTIGLTTNVIKKFRKSGNTFGYKFGFYLSTDRTKRFDSNYGNHVLPGYVSNTLHLTRQRVTGFAQVNAGTFALNFQTGLNVRL